MLLCTGANCDVRTSDHEPILCWATRCAESALVELLLNFGAEVNQQDDDGYTALHHAVYSSELDLTGLLLSSGADPNLEDWSSGFIPLLSALQQPDWDILELLLIDTDVNHANWQMKTVLHIAACYQQFPLAKRLLCRLLDQGANINARTTTGGTPLMCSVSAEEVDFNFVRTLVDAGADVNQADCKKYTALHLAASSTADVSLEITRLLIDSGANVNAKNDNSSTPLFEAVRVGNTAVVKILIQANCDVNSVCVVERRTTTPLSFAVMGDDIDSIVMLLAAGAVCPQNLIGMALAHHALSALAIRGNANEGDLTPKLMNIKKLGFKPLDLTHLCRIVIRNHLPAGCKLKSALGELKLPSKLKEYVVLRDVDALFT